MSKIKVPAGEWVEIFDSNTSGSFKTFNFKGRVLRATTTPTGHGGLPIEGGKGVYSDIIALSSDGTNNLYIYNPSTETGFVLRDT